MTQYVCRTQWNKMYDKRITPLREALMSMNFIASDASQSYWLLFRFGNYYAKCNSQDKVSKSKVQV